MKIPLRLRLEPRRSRMGNAFVAAAAAATSALLVLLPLPVEALLAGGGAVLAVLGSALWRSTGGRPPAVIHVDAHRRIAVIGRDGRCRDGVILDDSYVGAWLTSIVWRADGEPWWRPAHTLLVLPDVLARDEFRRLRVLLRYGRPAGDEETSGVDDR